MELESIIAEATQEVLKRLMNENKSAPLKISSCPNQDIAGVIEHSAMNPDTTEELVKKACLEARKYRFANVCVFPYFVALAVDLLKGSGICVCTAVAFPHGAIPLETKLFEAKEAIKNGARELDVAMNISAIKSGRIEEAGRDLESVILIAGGKAIIKAIYEQGLYSENEKIEALNIACKAGADFIKIQNYLTGKKAIPEDVAFVRSVIGKSIGIKIDGGVSDAETLRKLLEAGANRVGCSRSVKIVRGE